MMMAALSNQPQAPVVWMQKPAGDGSPLSYFKPLSNLSIKQVVSIGESKFNQNETKVDVWISFNIE